MSSKQIINFKLDCSELITKFLEKNSLKFDEFASVWREMKFSFVFFGQRPLGLIRQFTEEALKIAKCYWLKSEDLPQSIAGLYLMYGLYFKNRLRGLIHIPLTLDDLELVNDYAMKITDSSYTDASFILQKLFDNEAFHFSASANRYGLERSYRTKQNVKYRPDLDVDLEESMSNVLKELEKLVPVYNEYIKAKQEIVGIVDDLSVSTSFLSAILPGYESASITNPSRRSLQANKLKSVNLASTSGARNVIGSKRKDATKATEEEFEMPKRVKGKSDVDREKIVLSAEIADILESLDLTVSSFGQSSGQTSTDDFDFSCFFRDDDADDNISNNVSTLSKRNTRGGVLSTNKHRKLNKDCSDLSTTTALYTKTNYESVNLPSTSGVCDVIGPKGKEATKASKNRSVGPNHSKGKISGVGEGQKQSEDIFEMLKSFDCDSGSHNIEQSSGLKSPEDHDLSWIFGDDYNVSTSSKTHTSGGVLSANEHEKSYKDCSDLSTTVPTLPESITDNESNVSYTKINDESVNLPSTSGVCDVIGPKGKGATKASKNRSVGPNHSKGKISGVGEGQKQSEDIFEMLKSFDCDSGSQNVEQLSGLKSPEDHDLSWIFGDDYNVSTSSKTHTSGGVLSANKQEKSYKGCSDSSITTVPTLPESITDNESNVSYTKTNDESVNLPSTSGAHDVIGSKRKETTGTTEDETVWPKRVEGNSGVVGERKELSANITDMLKTLNSTISSFGESPGQKSTDDLDFSCLFRDDDDILNNVSSASKRNTGGGVLSANKHEKSYKDCSELSTATVPTLPESIADKQSKVSYTKTYDDSVNRPSTSCVSDAIGLQEEEATNKFKIKIVGTSYSKMQSGGDGECKTQSNEICEMLKSFDCDSVMPYVEESSGQISTEDSDLSWIFMNE